MLYEELHALQSNLPLDCKQDQGSKKKDRGEQRGTSREWELRRTPMWNMCGNWSQCEGLPKWEDMQSTQLGKPKEKKTR